MPIMPLTGYIFYLFLFIIDKSSKNVVNTGV